MFAPLSLLLLPQGTNTPNVSADLTDPGLCGIFGQGVHYLDTNPLDRPEGHFHGPNDRWTGRASRLAVLSGLGV